MRFLGIINILEHDGRAGDADLAFEIRIKFLRGAGLDDFIIGIRERHADRADAVIVLRRQAGGCDALGQAIALTNLHGSGVRLEEIIDLFLQFDRHAVAAGEDALEAAEVCVFKLFSAQQRLKQRRDTGNDIRLLLDEQFCIGIDVELRDKDAACAADEGSMDADTETKAMEHGHDREHLHAVDGCKARGGNSLKAQRVKVHVGQKNALSCAGRTAGIEDRRARFRLAELSRKRQITLFADALEFRPPDVIALFRGLGVFAACRQRVADCKVRIQLILNLSKQKLAFLVIKFGHDGRDLGIELVKREDALGMREIEIEPDLPRSGKRMDHVGHRADAVQAIERVQGLRAVGHTDGDAVALFDAHGEKRLRRLVDLLHELREGRLFAHEFIGRQLRIALCCGLDHLIDSLLRIRQMMRHITVIF